MKYCRLETRAIIEYINGIALCMHNGGINEYIDASKDSFAGGEGNSSGRPRNEPEH